MLGNLVFTRIPGNPLVSNGIVGNAYFHLVFTRGNLENRCGHAARIPAFPQLYTWYSPRLLPGFWWEVSFLPGFFLGKHQGVPRFSLVFTRGRTGVTENLVFTWGKPVFQVRPGKTW